MTQQAPTRRTTRVATRTRQIARAKGLVRKLDWTDRRYRCFLEDTILRDSLRQATRPEREAVIKRLETELSPRSAPYSPAELDRIRNADSLESLWA